MTEQDSSRANAMRKLGIHEKDGVATLDRESLMNSVGGWLGIIQSSVPAALFVLVFALTKNTVAAVVISLVVSSSFVVLQLVTRKPVTQAIAGALGIALSAYLTLRDGGHPADYFIQGFFTNIAYGLVLAISILVRWPVIGFLVGLFRSEPLAWRSDKKLLRRADLATALFVALFSLRLAVQLPLYFANQIEALGIARVAMGVPLYALCIWLSWLLLRSSISATK
ncbi:unannotated protein [freshwater metagenome]|uniref:Unannotated protein n=1 Tax=freshwater metagenome TaxID=449393 RepID=A0A6J6JCS4_9ZZZZ|nr:DUF3159 domain-containing protein [Actinomycetota bacterium]